MLREHRLSAHHQQRVLEEFCGLGPLADLITRSDVTEIILNGPEAVWYESNGRLVPHDDGFYSETTYRNFLQRVFVESGVFIDQAKPAVDGSWRGFRLHVIGEPLAPLFPHLTLRRIPTNPWTLDRLVEHQWCDPQAALALKDLVSSQQSMLIIGPTGSGKTSVLNACLQGVGPDSRTLLLEDTPELTVPNSVSTRLVTRDDSRSQYPRYDLCDLLRQSLRMRPDRLIMGEIRGAEAKDLLLTLSTGHRGGMATLHADSAAEALLRLEILIQMGAPQWQLETIRRLIFFGIQYVILATKNEGRRRFAGAFRLVSLESCGFLLERTF
jgi:pilus assembly protein CpaF